MIVESYEDVIHLSGALRSNFWETIHTAISLTLKRHPSGVIIDCSGITECTPDGAETFRDAMEFIERFDARIIVAAVPEQVLEVLRSVREVRSQLPIAGSIEEARRSLDLLVVQPATKKKPNLEVRTAIVLHLAGDDRDPEGAAASARMANDLHAEVVLTYVIVVPRDLPIQSPMEKQESAAVASIALAQQLLNKLEIPNRAVVERGRDVASALEAVVGEQRASYLVLPLSPHAEKLEDDLKTVRSVLTKVQVPIVFVRSAKA
jgi:hypothetical protein